MNQPAEQRQTTGYEEAAGLGLVAGINAAAKLQGQPEFVLGRHEAYLGVLVDDLVVCDPSEPYRMFTSRAEHRLLLREDNADLRLAEKGLELGLLDQESGRRLSEKKKQIASLVTQLSSTRINPSVEVQNELESLKQTRLKNSASLAELLRRPGLDIPLLKHSRNLNGALSWAEYPRSVCEQSEIQIKYEGYLTRQNRESRHASELERIRVPATFNFSGVPGLSSEVVEILERLQPENLGQASRVSGITPAALTILRVYLRSRNAA